MSAAAMQHTGDYETIKIRSQEEQKRWRASGGKSPGVGAPSARVLASKGRKSKYVITFHDSCDPAVRERVGAGIARIDARPHRDPVWKATDYRAMPTEAQRLAAACRVLSYLVSAVDPTEECGESPDKGPHVPMADGRCSLCDRTLPEWRCQTCTREGYGGPPQHCPGCTSERDDRHGPAPTSVPARPFRGAGAYSRRAS